MPRKCELRLGAPEHWQGQEAGPLSPEPLVQFKFSRQLAGISGTSSDAVTSSHRKISFDSRCVLADYELYVQSSALDH